jgi:hypothetical protein
MADLATLIVLGCVVAAWRAGRPRGIPVRYQAVAGVIASVVMVVVRIGGGAAATLDVACLGMLVLVGLLLGYWLVVRHEWPAGAMVLALAVATAGGTFWRQDRLEAARAETLHPDVRHFQQQARQAFNPYAAGLKSPLWSAMHAPVIRLAGDPNQAMRFWSWVFGVAMLPIAGLVVGRLFDPVVGVVVAGWMAADSYLVSLCCEGLREEMGLCLWMVVLCLLFDRPKPSWKRVIFAGAAGGILIWLRNTEVAPLIALLVWAAISRRWKWQQAAVGLVMPLLIVLPFYVNQYRVFGDPFAMEKREARSQVNLEFMGRSVPGDVSMPTPEEVARDPFAGGPISPAKYLFGMHSIADLARRQWQGVYEVLSGRSFEYAFSRWTALACAAGLVATALSRRHRFVIVLVLFSLLGMRAHMISLGHLDLRLLLPVMVMWLTAGVWLAVMLVRIGGRRWLAMSAAGGRLDERPRSGCNRDSGTV